MTRHHPRSIVRSGAGKAWLRLFCFPFAGGGASVFHSWAQALPEGVEVCAIQPPGREARIGEPPVGELDVLVRRLLEETVELRQLPFAFFGHSVGALVAFEMTRTLRRLALPLPLHLFVSASSPPLFLDGETLSALPDALLIERLRELEGTPTVIIEDSRLMQLFLPALRADLALRDGYRGRSEPPLPLPITAFGGDRDASVGAPELARWRDETTTHFDLKLVHGGHFFIKEARSEFLATLSRSLDPLRLRASTHTQAAYSHVF